MKDTNKLSFLLFIGIFVLNISYASSQNSISDSLDKPIPLDKTVRVGKLENGFTYYLKRNPKPANEVYMKLVVKAGSLFEKEPQLGYAHLLEHVALFNGEPQDLNTIVESAGMIPRASTGYINTRYQLIIPNNTRDKTQLALNTMKSWAGELKFDSLQINVQRGAVLGELRNIDPYQNWLSIQFGKILLQNVEFPYYSDEKVVQNIKRFNLSALKEFYDDWYRPEHEAIIIVGDIKPDSVEGLVKSTFYDLKKKIDLNRSADILKNFNIHLKGGNQYIQMKDSIQTGRRLVMFKKERNYDYNKFSEEDYRKMFLQKIVNLIIHKRAIELQKQYNPPFSNYSINHTSSFVFVDQVLVSAMKVDLNGNPLEIENKIISALSAYKGMFSGFTKEELDNAKKSLEIEFEKRFKNNFELMEIYFQNFVRGATVPSKKWQLKLNNLLTSISLDEIQKFAEKESKLTDNKDFVFINIPSEVSPRKKEMSEIIHNITDKNFAFKSPVGNIKIPDSVIKIKSKVAAKIKVSEDVIGVTKVELNNGLKLLFKPSTPRFDAFKNQIEILGFKTIPGKGPKKIVLTEILAHDYASYSGAGRFNKFQIAQYMQDHNIELNFFTEDDDFLIKGKFKQENLKDFFKLLFLKIYEPDKDSLTFSSWKEEEESRLIENRARGGSTFFRSEIEKIWHPDYPFITKATLDSIRRKELLLAYKKHFSNFRNYTFILTGDFESDSLRRQITDYFEALPVFEKNEVLETNDKEFTIEKKIDTIRLKNLAQAYAEIYYPIKVPFNTKTRIILEIISRALNERIFDRLRTGCYAPVADGIWLDQKKGIYSFRINFDSALGNEKNMLSYAKDEFDKLRESGVNQAWLSNLKNNQATNFQRSINSFGYFNFWPSYLKKSIKNKENPEDYILKYRTILQNFLSLEEVNKAMREYLTEANQQTFLVLPEK